MLEFRMPAHFTLSEYVLRPLPRIVFVLVVATSGCAPSIAPYSPAAYELAVDLKVDALRLMDLAEFPAAEHARRIESIERDLDRAWEFAQGRPANEHTTRQWALMRSPDHHLLGGFLAEWRRRGQLSPVFIAESKRLTGLAFDAIIGLESGKLQP